VWVLRARHGIALSCLCLVVLGVVFVTSASLDVARGGQTTLTGLLFGRATLFAAISMVCLWIGSLVPVERMQHLRGVWNPVWWILLASIGAIVLVHVPGVGREVNGASRWIAVGPIIFQPSEIAKWGMPLVIAWWCCFRGAQGLSRFWSGFVPPVTCVGAIALGIAVEDLGTATLVLLVSLIVLVAAGCRWWHAALLMPAAALGFVALIITSPYRVNRILAYLDPYDDARGIGYHIIQSMGAISGGGLTGRGLGNSVQKFGYLPEGTTDFIYAIICEETGLIGALLVVLLYAGLLWSGWCIVGAVRDAGDGSIAAADTADAAGGERRARLSPYCQIVGLGVLATIGFQALINMLVVTGLAPTKGIALPLVSRGGTGWMLTCLSLGLLMAMDRAMQREDERMAGAVSAPSASAPSASAPSASAPAASAPAASA